MKAIIEISTGNIISRGNIDYIIPEDQASNWEVIEFDPSEWPKITVGSETICVDHKQAVRWNGTGFELKADSTSEDYIIENAKFHAIKRIEHYEKTTGSAKNKDKEDIRDKNKEDKTLDEVLTEINDIVNATIIEE